MSRSNVEVQLSTVSDYKEFSPISRSVGALACAPGACGGGPGGACQGACRGSREYISFQLKEVVKTPAK